MLSQPMPHPNEAGANIEPPRLARLFPRRLMLDDLATTGRRSNSFDLLRLIAALVVLFAHAFDLMGRREPIPRITNLDLGTIGVLVFFSTSGFLVTRSWDRDPRLGPFLLRRVLRLWPGLVFSLLLAVLVVGPLVTTVSPASYFHNPLTVSFLINNTLMRSAYILPGVFSHDVYPNVVNGSLWTLPIEVRAYAIVAVIGLVATMLRWRGAVVLLAFVTVVVMVTGAAAPMRLLELGDQTSSPIVAYHWAAYTTCFLVGAAIYQLRRWVPVTWWLCAISIAACLLTAAIDPNRAFLWWAVLTPYIVLCLAYRTSRYMRMPSRAGDYSYGIYIYAFVVQQTISYLTGPISGWSLFAIALLPTIALAMLSWHFVESPFLSLRSQTRASHADGNHRRVSVTEGRRFSPATATADAQTVTAADVTSR